MTTNQTKIPAILWLTRNGFFLYGQSFANALSLAFPPDCVNHLEVVNEDKLSQLITAFITQNRLPPLNLYIVVGPDALFESIITFEQPDKAEEIIKKWLDTIPFENIYSLSIIVNKQPHYAVFNADFYNAFNRIVTKFGWSIVAASPYFITGQNNFSQPLAQSLLSNPQLLIHHNFIKTVTHGSEQLEKATANKAPTKSALPWLLAVFIGLLIILIIVVFITSSSKRKLKPTEKLVPSLSPSPIISPSFFPSPLTTISPTGITTQSGNLDIQPSPTLTNYPITITP